MTEAIEAPSKTTRTHDLHAYKVLSEDWLTQHQPRTFEHMLTHPDATYEMSLMSEIGDGVFVAWSQCRRCSHHYTSCTCTDGPQEPEHITTWRARRFAGSFDTRPDLGADREVVGRVVKELRDRGYAIGEIPDPIIKEVEVKVVDHSLFLQLFKAAADCEAPEGTQLDEVLATFQEAYDQFTVAVELVGEEAQGESSYVDGIPEDAEVIDSLTEKAGEALDAAIEAVKTEPARDLKEYDVDF